MEMSVFGYLLLLIAVTVGFQLYKDSDFFQLTCIISDVDGKRYCVRERSKLALAADRLASVSGRMSNLVRHLGETYPDRPNCKRLVSGYDPKEIYETLPTSELTAYSENKGEKLAFCLDTERQGGRLIDDNTLTFVALHELAHVATESIGHTEEFWRNFRFLLQEAHKTGVYKPVDYKRSPARYCGMTISDNPYFDH
jgi:hypothetical protein